MWVFKQNLAVHVYRVDRWVHASCVCRRYGFPGVRKMELRTGFQSSEWPQRQSMQTEDVAAILEASKARLWPRARKHAETSS